MDEPARSLKVDRFVCEMGLTLMSEVPNSNPGDGALLPTVPSRNQSLQIPISAQIRIGALARSSRQRSLNA
jgi:hypothetical protein